MKKQITPANRAGSRADLYLLMNEVFALRDEARAIEARFEAEKHGRHNPYRKRKAPVRSRSTTVD
jgi:hypothetical protein